MQDAASWCVQPWGLAPVTDRLQALVLASALAYGSYTQSRQRMADMDERRREDEASLAVRRRRLQLLAPG